MLKKYEEVLDFINNYNTGNFVYPSVIKRRFGIDGLITYNILETFVEKGVLQRVYQLQCVDCGYINEIIYDSLNQIEEDDLICHRCRCDLHILKCTIMFYKKK